MPQIRLFHRDSLDSRGVIAFAEVVGDGERQHEVSVIDETPGIGEDVGIELDEELFLAELEFGSLRLALLRCRRDAGGVSRLEVSWLLWNYEEERGDVQRKQDRGEVVGMRGVQGEFEPLAMD